MNKVINKIIIVTIITVIMFSTTGTTVFASSKIGVGVEVVIKAVENIKKTKITMIELVEKCKQNIINIKMEDVAHALNEMGLLVEEDFQGIADICMSVLRKNNFYYSSRTYNFVKNPPSSKTSIKGIDCSGYVSWVIYVYAKNNGKPELMNDFSKNVSTSEMLKYMKDNSKYFTKIGKLSEIKVTELKPGDIIIKNGHVEIFAKYDSKVKNKYRCYNAGKTECIKDNEDGTKDGITGGGCNSKTKDYTVFRIK